MSPGKRFLKRRKYDKAWLINETPSRKAGVPYEVEEELRQAYCQLLLEVGQKLGLCVAFNAPHNVMFVELVPAMLENVTCFRMYLSLCHSLQCIVSRCLNVFSAV